jgi:hypothetical protein
VEKRRRGEEEIFFVNNLETQIKPIRIINRKLAPFLLFSLSPLLPFRGSFLPLNKKNIAKNRTLWLHTS